MPRLNREERKAVKRKLEQHRGTMGLIRKEYFENGGDLAGWRGRSSVQTDRRKKKNKKACRGRVEVSKWV
jgi:hypothetical protein